MGLFRRPVFLDPLKDPFEIDPELPAVDSERFRIFHVRDPRFFTEAKGPDIQRAFHGVQKPVLPHAGPVVLFCFTVLKGSSVISATMALVRPRSFFIFFISSIVMGPPSFLQKYIWKMLYTRCIMSEKYPSRQTEHSKNTQYKNQYPISDIIVKNETICVTSATILTEGSFRRCHFAATYIVI